MQGGRDALGYPSGFRILRPPAVSVLLSLTTCPDAACAERIADALVGERLAACVNILPGVRSVYRWQDRVERGVEVLLLAKTTPERAAKLQQRIVALHPYELPEVILVETAGGLAAYLGWVASETAPVRDPGG